MRPIYLDYHATTPCDPQVVAAMLPYFSEEFGNPSSGLHLYGRRADDAVEIARGRVASLIGASPSEIIFTSGATESNNIVIFGIARGATTRRRIVTTAIEHKAILEPYKALAEQGFETVILPVDRDGTVDLGMAEKAITDETLLVSIHASNNEIGTIQPVGLIADIARQNGALIHTDAAQSIGKVPFDVEALGVDFASISGHKLYGPKGIGALYIRSRLLPRLMPLAVGGGQESGLRPGTLNVPGIVGLGEACKQSQAGLQVEGSRVAGLRDEFENQLISAVPGLRINGNKSNRLPGNSSLTFPGVEADALILNLPELALSAGSACTSGALAPSHVLTGIGISREAAYSTIRIGFGRFSTIEEVAVAAMLVPEAWNRLVLMNQHTFDT